MFSPSLTLSIDTDPLARVLMALPGVTDLRREPMRAAAGSAMDALMEWEHARFRHSLPYGKSLDAKVDEVADRLFQTGFHEIQFCLGFSDFGRVEGFRVHRVL